MDYVAKHAWDHVARRPIRIAAQRQGQSKEIGSYRASIGTWLPFAIGLSLPLISFQTGSSYRDDSLLERIAVVDVLTILAVICCAVVGRMSTKLTTIVYGGALAAGFSVAISSALSANETLDVLVTESIALVVALMYWFVGFNVVRTRSFRPLLIGIACGILWQSVIVLHDWMSTNRWFVDNMEGRVRGTFRKSGQLAAYGFSAAGTLLTLSRFTRRSWWQALMIASGVLGLFFMIAASRRSALFAVFAWVATYAFLAGPQSRRLSYYVPAIAIACAGFLAISHVDLWIDSLFGSRVIHGVERLGTLKEDFLFEQFAIAYEHYGEWFPFGLGIGRGRNLMDGLEFHNLYLALAIEIGIFGLVAFLGMAIAAIRHLRRVCPQRSQRLWVTSFFFAAALFGVHNRLHRDRSFMLFLGLASGLHVAQSVVGSRLNGSSQCKLIKPRLAAPDKSVGFSQKHLNPDLRQQSEPCI